jgi:hypothetical protein
MRLWSSEAEGFISQNGEVLGVIDRISSRAKKRGVYVIDRGGDGDWLFDGLGRLFTRHRKWNGYKPPDPESNPLGLVFLE